MFRLLNGADATNPATSQTRYLAATRFGWFGYGTTAPDPDTYFSDSPLVVYGRDEYRAMAEAGTDYRLGPYIGRPFDIVWTTQTSFSALTRPNDMMWETLRPIFLQKGQCVEYRFSTDSSQQRYNPFILFENGTTYGVRALFKLQSGPATNHMQEQALIGYYKAERDSYLIFQRRLPMDAPAPGSAAARITEFTQLGLRFIREAEYLDNTALFEGELLCIPDARGLEFHHVNNVMAYDRSDDRNYSEVLLQIRQNGKILANLLNREEVQGQGTAGGWNPKPNLDIKARNAAGKKVAFKFGHWKESAKATLKSYTTELSNVRDTAAAEIWRQIRRDRAYPDNMIFDPRLLDQTDSWAQGRYMADAVCSTRGVPCTVWAGRKFNGLYTLREKKDVLNYGIDPDNPDNIWLQSDYKAYGAFINCEAPINWQAWEIASPELDGYTSGDDITIVDPALAGKIARVFQWIADARAGTVDFLATCQDYLYLDTWMDYLIAAELLKHRDGERNNVIMTTNDAMRWSAHIYDMDWTLGIETNGSDKTIASGLYFDRGVSGVWKLLYDHMRPQIEARWAELRKGALRTENVLSIIRSVSCQMSDSQRAQDAQLWGTKRATDNMYIMDWAAARIDWLDGEYHYAP